DPDNIKKQIEIIRHSRKINLMGKKKIGFDEHDHIIFHRDKVLPYHPNGMRFSAFDQNGVELFVKIYYSVGGGFIVDHETASKDKHLGETSIASTVPYPFSTAEELLRI